MLNNLISVFLKATLFPVSKIIARNKKFSKFYYFRYSKKTLFDELNQNIIVDILSQQA